MNFRGTMKFVMGAGAVAALSVGAVGTAHAEQWVGNTYTDQPACVAEANRLTSEGQAKREREGATYPGTSYECKAYTWVESKTWRIAVKQNPWP